ncbi:hypothetical protein BD770DRAFT_146062 [Pilaira anomala]|nr:hypothetical protein BD770DRAFT_146062 [Pilaira anomala]
MPVLSFLVSIPFSSSTHFYIFMLTLFTRRYAFFSLFTNLKAEIDQIDGFYVIIPSEPCQIFHLDSRKKKKD